MLASNWFGYEISRRDDRATSSGLCRVCGDHASGNHFGVLSCEACRSFFRRSVRVSSQYACRGARNCPVTAKTRNRCPFCRLQKCLAAGMRRQDIKEDPTCAPATYHMQKFVGAYWTPPTTFPSPQAVANGPVPIDMHAMPGYPVRGYSGFGAQPTMPTLRAYNPVSPPCHGAGGSMVVSMVANTTGCISSPSVCVPAMPSVSASLPQPETLTNPTEHLIQSRAAEEKPLKPPPILPSQVPNSHEDTLISGPDVTLDSVDLDALIQSHNDIFKFPTQVKEIAKSGVDVKPLIDSAKQSLTMLGGWFRSVPTFMQLPWEERLKCLKACWVEQLVLNLVFRSVVQTPDEGLLFHTGIKMTKIDSINHSLTSYSVGRIKGELMTAFRDLQLDYKEFVIIRLLVLLNPDTLNLDEGIKTHVQQIQDQLLMTLEDYCSSKGPSNIQRFGKLLLAVASLKGICQESTQEVEVQKLIAGANFNDELFESMCA